MGSCVVSFSSKGETHGWNGEGNGKGNGKRYGEGNGQSLIVVRLYRSSGCADNESTSTMQK